MISATTSSPQVPAGSTRSAPTSTPYGPVESCPVCAAEDIRPDDAAGERWSFRCDECGMAWRYALGHLIVC